MFPSVLGAEELLDVAFRKASKATARGTTRLETRRRLAIARIEAVRDVLRERLQGYVRAYPNFDELHPFQRQLADVLVGVDVLRHHIGAVNWAARRTSALAAEARREVGRSRRIDEVARLRRAFYGRVASLLRQVEENLEGLRRASDALRRLPEVDPTLPTVVVAGSPNVGKSTLIRRLSTAQPTVASYPFTTKGILLGHADFRGRRVQFLDTPGLLDRPLAQRNRMERQAIAALTHVASVAVFVIDPTETCGYGLPEQTHLLQCLREEFPTLRFVVVDNKADVARHPSDHVKVSGLTGEGVDALRETLQTLSVPAAPLLTR